MFARILIPVDFGPSSDLAIRVAQKLAAPAAKVRLLHVLTNETSMFYADVLPTDRFGEHAVQGLEARKKAHHVAGRFEIDTQVREGTIAEEILAEAHDWKPDLVVMGSHGRKLLPRLLLGSVAERVLRKTLLPVCVVKGPVSDAAKLERVALATDLEPASQEGRREFESILTATGAAGFLVHAFHAEHWVAMVTVPPPYLAGPYPISTVPDTQLENRLQEQKGLRENELAKVAKDMRARKLDVREKLVEGQPWEEIAKLAEAEQIDLLVLGTHHYSGLDRLVLGSVAEKTVRAAHCPVLVVPHRSAPASEGKA